MKACSKCRVVKPLSDFFARTAASDGRMSSCKTCKTAALYAWREKNADRWREYVREEIKRPHRAAKRADYRQSEPAKELARARERGAKVRATKAEWLAANPDKARAFNKNRNARRRARKPIGTVSAAEWSAVKAKHAHRCRYCNEKSLRLTMDHVVPISAGGAHHVGNIVPACRPCNSRKKDIPAEVFARRMGRLFW